MNVELLEKVKAFILEHPEHFDMGQGLGDISTGCGTTACIAGTACLLELENPLSAFKNKHPWQVWSKEILTEEELEEESDTWFLVKNKAAELLEITESQANELFLASRWNDDFRARLLKAGTPEEEAVIAAEYIDHASRWSGDFRARFLKADTPEEEAVIAAEYIDHFISKYQNVA